MKFSFFPAMCALLSHAVIASPIHSHDTRAACVSKVGYIVRNGVNYTTFDDCTTNYRIEVVKNSGICEKTQGVNQYSGYVSFGLNKDINMFFWFFEARSSPETAPFALWMNGGPGCSSMIGLFQENGPCQFYNGASEPSVNPYSFNNYANMLYVDQPQGTGFSFSSSGKLVNSSNSTAPYFWNFLQAFYTQFPKYSKRELGLFTESYGGHFAPSFVRHFQNQNRAIDAGKIPGVKVQITALGINNGWYDMKQHLKSQITYATANPYRPLINSTLQRQLNATFYSTCAPMLDKCQATRTSADCVAADYYCNDNIVDPLMDGGDFSWNDVRLPEGASSIPETYIDYLARPDIRKSIGARTNYTECSEAVYDPFDVTGDEARSSVVDMSSVVQSGVNVVMWYGDSDMDCNYISGKYIAENLAWDSSATFRGQSTSVYKVQGVPAGMFKSTKNLNYLQVYGAGHKVMFYRPRVSLQVFKQIMMRGPLMST